MNSIWRNRGDSNSHRSARQAGILTVKLRLRGLLSIAGLDKLSKDLHVTGLIEGLSILTRALVGKVELAPKTVLSTELSSLLIPDVSSLTLDLRLETHEHMDHKLDLSGSSPHARELEDGFNPFVNHLEKVLFVLCHGTNPSCYACYRLFSSLSPSCVFRGVYRFLPYVLALLLLALIVFHFVHYTTDTHECIPWESSCL